MKTLSELAEQLKELRTMRKTFEDEIDKVEEQIFSQLEVGQEVEVERFRIKTVRVTRQIFDKNAFEFVFGKEQFSKVSKQSEANIIYLTERKRA